MPIGASFACGGHSGGSDNNDDVPFEGSYQSTATATGQTTPTFTGEITISDSGDLSGTLAYGPYDFDVDGHISADGSFSFTTHSNNAENLFVAGNGTFTGDLDQSSGTLSGTASFDPDLDPFTTQSLHLVLSRRQAL